MHKFAATLAAVMIFLALSAGLVFAGDIVTMPTANQLDAGAVDLAQYYVSFDYPAGLPDNAFFTTMYVGVTDWLEIDAWYLAAQHQETQTVLNATVRVQDERKGDYADVVLGLRDMGDNLHRLFGSDFERGYFVAAAKTLNPPAGPPTAQSCPIWRLHLGLGTHLGLASDLDHIAKNGMFGGVQALVTPQWGAIALWDGTDDIIGVTYTPTPKSPTFKCGVFGKHTWIGANYTFTH